MKYRPFQNLSFLLIFTTLTLYSFGSPSSFQTIEDAGGISPDSTILLDNTTNKVDDLTCIEDTVKLFTNKRLDDQDVARVIIKDSPVATMLDSLVNISFFKKNYFVTDTAQLNIYQYLSNSVPEFSDSVYSARISMLSGQTPFEMSYNSTVKGFIELYSVRKRGLTSRMLGLSEVYFPMFEEILDAYGLPLELKYLAVVESALNPIANSPAGARGLWQFMYNTGKGYGLTATSYVDDRCDPFKSTIAACQHLRDLYNIYQDWALVLAAYNSGAGNVNKAIRRAGGVKDYYAIWPYLPKETRGYVPAFVAVNYVMNYSADHNLYPVDPGILYNGIDTVHICDVLSFDQISEFLNIPVEDLKFLNPSFKLGVIPAHKNNEYILRLPRQFVGEFVSNETEIYNFKSKKGLERENLLAQIKQVKESSVHTVKKGESLAGIARKYHVSVNNLKSWNNIKGSTVHRGQKLTVFADAVKVEKRTTETKTNAPQINSEPTEKQSYHIVKSGDNLGLIAKKYHCTVADLQAWNKLKSNSLQVNQRLLVYAPAPPKKEIAPVETSKNSEGKAKYVYHTVKSGDTLWNIARQYEGATVNEIKKLNNLSNAATLKPGQKIKVAIVI